MCGLAAFLFVPYQDWGSHQSAGEDASFTTQSYQRGARLENGSTYKRRTNNTSNSNRSYSSNYSRYRNQASQKTPRTTNKSSNSSRADGADELAAYKKQQQVKNPTYNTKPVVTSSITTFTSSSSSSSSNKTTSSNQWSNTGSSSAWTTTPPKAPAQSQAPTSNHAGDVVYPNQGKASDLYCPKRDFNIAYNTTYNDNNGNEYKLKYGTKSFVNERNVQWVKKRLSWGGLECKYSPNEVKKKTIELTRRHFSPCTETSEGNFQCGSSQTSCPDLTSRDFIRQVSHPQNDVQGQRFNWEEDTLNAMHNKSTVKFIQSYWLPSGNSTNITCQYELDIKGDHFKKDTHLESRTDTKNEAYRIKSICPTKVEGNLNGFTPKGYVPGWSTYRETNRYPGHNRHRCYYKDSYGQDVPNPLTKRYDVSELEECSGTLTTDNATRELRCKLK